MLREDQSDAATSQRTTRSQDRGLGQILPRIHLWKENGPIHTLISTSNFQNSETMNSRFGVLSWQPRRLTQQVVPHHPVLQKVTFQASEHTNWLVLSVS